MISYNKQQFETMQQEAIKRVREMQKKAQLYVAPEVPVDNKNPKSSTSTFNKSAQQTSGSSSTQSATSHSSSNSNNIPPKNNQHNNRANISNPFAQLFGSNMGGFNRYKNNPANHAAKAEPAFVENLNKPPEHKDFLNNLFKDFAIDEEKLLLILLIYILYKNGADLKLILALGYLII